MKKFEVKLSEEERQLFNEAMRDVRPLKMEKRADIVKKNRRSNKIIRASDMDAPTVSSLTDCTDLTITADETIKFSRPGVNDKIFKKLQRGTLHLEASLDLHGETIATARTALALFIRRCFQNNQRYIRVIHGKGYKTKAGYPPLKNQVAYWLPQFSEVLAFQSATPQDGGAGAIYVLLKSR